MGLISFRLLLLCATFTSAQTLIRSHNIRANRSEELLFDGFLLSRDLFSRQNCPSGYGICADSGNCCPTNSGCCGDSCINQANTCCYGYGCPSGDGCCGTEGYCRPPGYGCCENGRNVYPLDGSVCCPDGSHCPPGSTCVGCNYDPSLTCCRGADDDYSDPSYNTDIATLTTPPATDTVTSYSTITSDDSSYSSYSVPDYEYYTTTYVYFYITFVPVYTPTTSSTVTTTVVLSAYVTDAAEARSSWSSLEQSISEDVSFSFSLYSPSSFAPASTSSRGLLSGGDDGSAVSGGDQGSGAATVGQNAFWATAMAIGFALLSLITGALAIAL